MNQEKLGKFIEKLRKNKNWTQKDLGERLGVSNGAVSKWECGNNLPDITMLEPLSKALDIGIMNLLNCKETNEEDLEVKNQNKTRKVCLKNFKYLTCIMCLILLISLCCLPLAINTVRSCVKKNKNDDIIKVYEFVNDEQENFLIKGYIIFNSTDTMVNITSMKYQSSESGTIDEIYTDKIKVILEIDDKEIYKFFSSKEQTETRTLSEIINEIMLQKDDELIGNYNLLENEIDFSRSLIRIECYAYDDIAKNDNVIEKFKINVRLNEKFS